MNSHMTTTTELSRAIPISGQPYRGWDSHAKGGTASNSQPVVDTSVAPTVDNCNVIQGFARVANLFSRWG